MESAAGGGPWLDVAHHASGRIGAAGLDGHEAERADFFEDLSGRVIADDLLARLTTFGNVLVTPHQA